MKLLKESSIQCPFYITAIQDKSNNNSQFQMNKCKAITQMKDKNITVSKMNTYSSRI